MNCRQCGATLPPGAAACPQCGTLTSTFYSGTGTSPNEPTVSSAREPTIPANPYRPNTAYGSNLYGAGIPPNYGPPSSPNYVNNPYTVPPGHGTNPYTTPPPNLYEYRPPAPPPRSNPTPLII